MKITRYSGNTDFPDYRTVTATANSSKASAGKETGNYDRISLNKSPYPEDDASFARILAHEAAVRLEGGVSKERVLALKQQVESGTYLPDARRIAEHMLGYR
ncbi:MAG: flagellar biosynthesis anti-sigma factor FlgM [Clostridiales bacterium]|nr:flagellar biosynthesis anti-sigma factor FlgM [Clostridiales bacterium]